MVISENVARGVALLDEHDPDWWRADVANPIDLGTLDLEHPSVCVLGQRCPLEVIARWHEDEADADTDLRELRAGLFDAEARYWAYAAALSGAVTIDDIYLWADDHGFAAPFAEYADLTATWRRVITERRTATP